MSILYDDLINLIDFKPDKDVEARIEKRLKNNSTMINIVLWTSSMLIAFAIFCIIEKFIWGVIGALIVLIIISTLYRCYLKKYSGGLVAMINEECNFNKALTTYMVMTRHMRNPKAYETMILAIGNCLLYLGKFDEAKKVLDLAEKYCNTPVGKAYRIVYYAIIARLNMDKEAVKQYIKELDILMPQINKPDIIRSYNNILKYTRNMEIEENGDYAKALEVFEQNENDPLLQKVNLNYHLCKIAKKAGLDAEAAKHRAFVLKHGGDTFYKKELEATL